jgi:hypothetical protein
LEIGSGIGELGMIAHKLGSETYTSIDLPSSSVIAAYSLMKAIGPENVWLFGEAPSSAFARFYPSTNYSGCLELKSHLVFNSDSFPEIPEAEQDRYLDLVCQTMYRSSLLMSFNQEGPFEGQRPINRAISQHGKLKLRSRAQWMIRDGYVEETYSL